jgi:Fur family peroxide stress response transcriptional regulator
MQNFYQKSKEKKLDCFKDVCKQHKIKLTPQRLIIYQELIRSDEHPSTDMVYQRVRKTFPTISFDTVNRTLSTFHEIGVAGLVEGSGNPKRYDGNLSKHHHFQCIACNRIIDIYDDSYNTLHISPEIQRKYTILNTTVHLEGICEQCK